MADHRALARSLRHRHRELSSQPSLSGAAGSPSERPLLSSGRSEAAVQAQEQASGARADPGTPTSRPSLAEGTAAEAPAAGECSMQAMQGSWPANGSAWLQHYLWQQVHLQLSRPSGPGLPGMQQAGFDRGCPHMGS